MKIGVHAGSLRGTGASVVGSGIARELIRISDRDLLLWVPASWDVDSPRAEIRRVPARGIVDKLRLENVEIRRAIRRRRISSLFSLGDTSLPWCDVPHLLLVQQAFLAYPPSEWGFTSPATRRRLNLIWKYFRLGLPTVRHFTVQSATMKDRLSSMWRIPPARISVVPSAVADCFREPPPPRTSPEPYVCFIGSAFEHKNYLMLADMLAILRQRGTRLACHVSLTEQDVPDLVARAAKLGVVDDLVFRGAMTAEQVRDALLGACALIMPSRMESFGLPYYEAMASGCPIIAADIDFAREACADAAFYSDDPAIVADIVQGLLGDSGEWMRRSAMARRRFEEVDRPWSWIVPRYLEIIEQIEGESSHA